MAYTNSAGVKLPNADIIIEADEDGTVTSCRDAVTGTEYIGGGGSEIETKSISVKNTRNATTHIQYASFSNENLYGIYDTFNASATKTINIAFYNGHAYIGTSSSYYLRGDDVVLDEDGYSTGVITGNAPIEIYYDD